MNAVLAPKSADLVPALIDALIAGFLAHLQVRGKARNTLLAYSTDLRQFASFARAFDITFVQLVDARLCNRWLDAGVVHLRWTQRTARRKLEALRSFLAWCRMERCMQHDPCAEIRINYRPRLVVAPEMGPLKAVIAGIGTDHPVDLRDRAVLMLLLDAALRANEVALLDMVTRDNPMPTHAVHPLTLRVTVRPKGGTDDDAQIVGLEPQTVDAVKAWLKARPELAADDEPALFVNLRGRRMSRQCIYVMVRQRGSDAGLPKLHPHMFRHRRIGDIVEKLGLDIGCAQARHRHKATTANVYGAHAAETQRNAVRTLAPLGAMTC